MVNISPIYGVSYQFDFGEYNFYVWKFNNAKDALAWKNSVTLRERELYSESALVQEWGKKALEISADYETY